MKYFSLGFLKKPTIGLLQCVETNGLNESNVYGKRIKYCARIINSQNGSMCITKCLASVAKQSRYLKFKQQQTKESPQKSTQIYSIELTVYTFSTTVFVIARKLNQIGRHKCEYMIRTYELFARIFKASSGYFPSYELQPSIKYIPSFPEFKWAEVLNQNASYPMMKIDSGILYHLFSSIIDKYIFGFLR